VTIFVILLYLLGLINLLFKIFYLSLVRPIFIFFNLFTLTLTLTLTLNLIFILLLSYSIFLLLLNLASFQIIL